MTRTARLCARSALHDHSLPTFRFDDPFTLDHNNRLVDSVGIDAELFGDLSHAWKEFAGRIGPAANRRTKASRDLPKDRRSGLRTSLKIVKIDTCACPRLAPQIRWTQTPQTANLTSADGSATAYGVDLQSGSGQFNFKKLQFLIFVMNQRIVEICDKYRFVLAN